MLIICVVSLVFIQLGASLEQGTVGEVFTYQIKPEIFNWTQEDVGSGRQYRYRPSLKDYPDLPSWLGYVYSTEFHAGFLYGTPPSKLGDKKFSLDIVALNKDNYETRHVVLDIWINSRIPYPNEIQMKIDNLNIIHLMDPGRIENLKNIFRLELWPESYKTLHISFMESAINMGGRMPLSPQQQEGVIVHLGSTALFSERLKELQEEVRPLYKHSTCNYKRTSVQKVFENVGFKLDWCAFKILGKDIAPEILYHNYRQPNNRRKDYWNGMSKNEVPVRNYIDEFAFAFAIPGMVLAVLLGILFAILCFQHEKLDSNCNIKSTVQMVQCSDTNNKPTTTLKSLKDPNILLDNLSIHSQSPNSSIYQTESPSNAYMRPKPPPYKGGTLGRSTTDSGVDI